MPMIAFRGVRISCDIVAAWMRSALNYSWPDNGKPKVQSRGEVEPMPRLMRDRDGKT